MKKLKAQYLDYSIDNNWRVRCYEETDDFIISAECFSNVKKWKSIVRFDQSDHNIYHSDFYNKPKYEYFTETKTFEEKVSKAFEKLKEYCTKKLINYEGKILIYSNVIERLKDQILRHRIPLKPPGEIITGTTRSFTVMASIINPTKKRLNSDV